MSAIDRAALIEAAAKAIHSRRVYMARGVTEQPPPPTKREVDDAAAALPVIAAGLLAQIQAQIAEWREFMHQPDMTSFEKSAIRMCASELGLLLDQIEADVRGGER